MRKSSKTIANKFIIFADNFHLFLQNKWPTLDKSHVHNILAFQRLLEFLQYRTPVAVPGGGGEEGADHKDKGTHGFPPFPREGRFPVHLGDLDF